MLTMDDEQPQPPQGYGSWQQYWTSRDMPWRTQPEIAADRQDRLGQVRTTMPDVLKGVYPFRGLRLTRADVEWLLATHVSDDRRGPVPPGSPPWRLGLDLRGANLSDLDLRGLPLSHLRGGLRPDELPTGETGERRILEIAAIAAIRLAGANLQGAHLEGAVLLGAHLEGADLRRTYFDQDTILDGAVFGTLRRVGERRQYALLAGIHWDSADVTRIKWETLPRIGDESEALDEPLPRRRRTRGRLRRARLEGASSTYLHLAQVLREQGDTRTAGRMAYRGQVLKRMLMFARHRYAQWFFRVALELLTGYGYHPWRLVAWYFAVVGCFTVIDFGLGSQFGPALSWPGAAALSGSSFLRLGFLPNFGTYLTPDGPLSAPLIWASDIEAGFGALVEGGLISLFAHYLFGW